jgi:uncharacterized membrane protein YciS (DUF1049 family)
MAKELEEMMTTFLKTATEMNASVNSNFFLKNGNFLLRLAEVFIALVVGGTIFYFTVKTDMSLNAREIKKNTISIESNTKTIDIMMDWAEEMRFNLKKSMENNGLKYETIEKIKRDKQ